MSSYYEEQLKSKEWELFRIPILNRDNGRCVECGDTHILQIHHDIYIRGRKLWEVPDDFVRTLCKKCHDKWHLNNEYQIKETYEIDLTSISEKNYVSINQYAEGYVELQKGQAMEIGQFTKGLCEYNKIKVKKCYGGNKYPIDILNWVFDNDYDKWTNYKLFGKYLTKIEISNDWEMWEDFRDWFYNNYNDGDYDCRFDTQLELYHQYEDDRCITNFIDEITHYKDSGSFDVDEYKELMRIIDEFLTLSVKK